MIIITRPDVTDAELDHIRERIESAGMRTHLSRGEQRTIIGCIGDESLLAGGAAALAARRRVGDAGAQAVQARVARVRASTARSCASAAATRSAFGGNAITVIAGPCSVESREMLLETAARRARRRRDDAARRRVQAAHVAVRLPGTRRARRSSMLAEVRAETGLPVVTEVMDTRQVDLVAEHADMLQVGARNMQNFALLAELGRVQRPVLLKRGLSATIKELLMAAEYIMAQRQSRRRAVRARHPHLRDGDAQHARRRGDPGAEARDAPAGDRRSEPRRRRRVARRAARLRGDRRGRRRPDRRGASRSRSARSPTATSRSRPPAFASLMDRIGAFAAAAGRTMSRFPPSRAGAGA